MIDPQDFRAALRLIHIVAGSLGLVVFWFPVFAKKGGRLHVLAGRLFVWLAWIVGFTAAISCIWALLAPIHFSGIRRPLSEDESRDLTREFRFLFVLLGLLTTWFLSGLQVGLRAVKTRRNQRQLGNLWTRVLIGIAALVSGMTLVFGVYQWGGGGEGRYIVFIVLGMIGVVDGLSRWRTLARPNPGKMDWWFLHMDNMLGSGIAFYTAFFVFGGRRLYGDLPGLWAIVPWIIPSAIGFPAIAMWKARYRRQFGSASSDPVDLTAE